MSEERMKETYKYAVITDSHGASGYNLDIRIQCDIRIAKRQSRIFKDAGYQSFVCSIDTLKKEYERCMKIIEGKTTP